jgi:hypothetical protein
MAETNHRKEILNLKLFLMKKILIRNHKDQNAFRELQDMKEQLMEKDLFLSKNIF